jgi:hypothetical protein
MTRTIMGHSTALSLVLVRAARPDEVARSVTTVEGNLLEQNVDVIVNAWNRNSIPWWLLLPQGVSGAIKKHGGTGPFKGLRKHGAIPLGGRCPTA